MIKRKEEAETFRPPLLSILLEFVSFSSKAYIALHTNMYLHNQISGFIKRTTKVRKNRRRRGAQRKTEKTKQTKAKIALLLFAVFMYLHQMKFQRKTFHTQCWIHRIHCSCAYVMHNCFCLLSRFFNRCCATTHSHCFILHTIILFTRGIKWNRRNFLFYLYKLSNLDVEYFTFVSLSRPLIMWTMRRDQNKMNQRKNEQSKYLIFSVCTWQMISDFGFVCASNSVLIPLGECLWCDRMVHARTHTQWI